MNQVTLNAKKEVVAEITNLINESASMVVCEYRGLSVNALEALRNDLRNIDASFRVYKNSMVTRALTETKHEDLNETLVGPNAVIFCKDPLASLKVAAKFARKNQNLVIKGGLVENRVVDAKEIKVLAKLPGREGLYSMFLSCLQAPVRSFACAVKAVADKANENATEVAAN